MVLLGTAIVYKDCQLLLWTLEASLMWEQMSSVEFNLEEENMKFPFMRLLNECKYLTHEVLKFINVQVRRLMGSATFLDFMTSH